MKIFSKGYDGGEDSGVTGYWLIEIKSLFSIVLLHFSPGTREAYHSHAFNALTWWLKGSVREVVLGFDTGEFPEIKSSKIWEPSIQPKYTPKQSFHKIITGGKGAWAISFRGPWDETWEEYKNGDKYMLTNGRKRIS